MQTECSAELFDFGRVEGRAVEAAIRRRIGDVGCRTLSFF